MNRNLNIQAQQGVALVIGLIVLLIMTLLGVTSMRSTTTELKAASNMQTYNFASEAAETAIGIVLDPDFPAGKIGWTLTTPQTLAHASYYDPGATGLDVVTGGKLSVALTITFVDCSSAPMGYSITEGGQDGTTMFNGMVHDVSASSAVVSDSSGSNIAQAQRLRGIQTMVVKCE